MLSSAAQGQPGVHRQTLTAVPSGPGLQLTARTALHRCLRLQAAFPTTKFILWRLLPREGLDMEPVNVAYNALAVQRGLTWITCGSDLDASNPAVLYDGTHPTPATQTQLLRCLAPTVYKLVGRSVRRQAAPRGADGSAAPAPAPMAAAEGPTGAIS